MSNRKAWGYQRCNERL